MRRRTLLLGSLLALALALALAAPAVAGGEMPAKKDPAGFDRIKALAGEWEGKTADGKPVRLTYKVASAGSVVVETLTPC